MLNVCPKEFSCGTHVSLWTDGLANKIGERYYTSVYGVAGNDCKAFRRRIISVRCSWNTDYDIVYKYIDEYFNTCDIAFCGMY